MRRRAGVLLPLERSILEAAFELRRRGTPEIHGFLLAKAIQEHDRARLLTAYGTLYKALERLERSGFLESRWEAPKIAASEGRPRRRFYRLTVVGETAVASARQDVGAGIRGSAAAEPAT